MLRESISLGTFPVSLGPVDFVVVPKLNFVVNASVGIGGTLTTSVNQSLSLTAGVGWNGHSLYRIFNLNHSYQYDQPTPSLAGSASASVGPQVTFDIDDIAGPDVDLTVGAELDVNSSSWKLDGQLSASAGIALDVWKIHFSANIDLFSFSWTLAHGSVSSPSGPGSGGGPGGGSGPPGPGPGPGPGPPGGGPPPSNGSISVGWGSNAAPSGKWMNITFTNFPTGPVTWYCVEENTEYGPYSTTLTSNTETLTSHTCYDTEAGGTDYVTADGVNSNRIPTDGPSQPPPPSASVSIGWGSNAAPAGNWMDITFTNFPTGLVSWYCVEEGTFYGPYSTTLTSSTETLTSHTCYDTEAGGSDYVTADGVNSNTIPTYSPPPPPPSKSISIGWGSNPAPAGNWMDITFTNFPTGSVSWYCVEEGTFYGPYTTTLTSSTETLTSHTCYDTQSGGTDYVTADGVNSNTIGTD